MQSTPIWWLFLVASAACLPNVAIASKDASRRSAELALEACGWQAESHFDSLPDDQLRPNSNGSSSNENSSSSSSNSSDNAHHNGRGFTNGHAEGSENGGNLPSSNNERLIGTVDSITGIDTDANRCLLAFLDLAEPKTAVDVSDDIGYDDYGDDSEDGRAFSCSGRPFGYYADVASGCVNYHVCGFTVMRRHSGVMRRAQGTFLCGRLMVFSQRELRCVRHESPPRRSPAPDATIECDRSARYFHLNEQYPQCAPVDKVHNGFAVFNLTGMSGLRWQSAPEFIPRCS